MTRRPVPAADRQGPGDRRGAGDRRGLGSLTVHPQWRSRIGGVAAPSLCDLRVLKAPDMPVVAGLLGRAGCLDGVDRHGSGRSLMVLAWLDRERLADLAAAAAGPAVSRHPVVSPHPVRSRPAYSPPPPAQPAAGQLDPRHPALGRLWPAGCVEIRWSGPNDRRIGDIAGACVEVGQLYVEPAVRRQGIGRALVAAAEQHCLSAGQPRLVAVLPPDDPGISTTEGALATAARAGYARLPQTGSSTGRAWVWRDLPEVSAPH
jgi:GNAT superfamily N-acetyltransferase